VKSDWWSLAHKGWKHPTKSVTCNKKGSKSLDAAGVAPITVQVQDIGNTVGSRHR